MSQNSSPVIAVDGATGYLGSHLVSRLRQSGVNVRCIVHPAAKEDDLHFLRSTGAEVRTASLQLPDASLDSALSGCLTVVHLIGSIAPKRGERLDQLHGEQTANLVSAAKRTGVEKIVQVTALGTKAGARSTYHQTKSAAEDCVKQSGLKYVILRPSLIVGRQVGGRNSKLISRYLELIKTRSAVPVIGGGKNKLQPVFIGDLTKALEIAAIESKIESGVYEIGGPEVISLREIVEMLMQVVDTPKKIAAIPPALASVLAAVCEGIQDVPTVSRDQVVLATEDNICTENALGTVFGVPLTPVLESLKTYGQTVVAAGR